MYSISPKCENNGKSSWDECASPDLCKSDALWLCYRLARVLLGETRVNIPTQSRGRELGAAGVMLYNGRRELGIEKSGGVIGMIIHARFIEIFGQQ